MRFQTTATIFVSLTVMGLLTYAQVAPPTAGGAGGGRAGGAWFQPPARGRSGAAPAVTYDGDGYRPTQLEGAGYGRAAVVSSMGEYNLSTSQAAINAQEAASMYMDNQYKWNETYWKRQRLGQAELEKDHAKKRESTQRYLETQRAARESAQPARLSTSELDPTTGKLAWPLALTDTKYASERKKLDELFQLRAQVGATTDLVQQIEASTQQLQTALRSNIRGMPANDYIAARKFLDNVSSESRHPTG